MASSPLEIKEQETMVRSLIRSWSKVQIANDLYSEETKRLQSILRNWLNIPKLEEEISEIDEKDSAIESELETLNARDTTLYETIKKIERSFQDKRPKWTKSPPEDPRRWIRMDREVLNEMDQATAPLEHEREELKRQIEELREQARNLKAQRDELEGKLEEIREEMERFMG